MRISHLMAQSKITSDMSHAREVRDKAASQISSGKKITRLSDDPAGAMEALRARRELQRAEIYSVQSQDAVGWLDNYDSLLSQFSDRLMRVREVSLYGQNTGSAGPEVANALADEIVSIKTELLALANSRYTGKPLFAGAQNPASVYNASELYAGDSTPYMRNVAPGVSLAVSIPGPDVFGIDGSGTQLFQTLTILENQVRTANSAGITSSINNLDVARERIETNRISVGVKTTTVEAVRTQREVANETLSRQISLVEDADLAEASIEFNSAQTAYNATLATAARLFESSLVNYLR